jgi:hypothetical protein
MPNKPLLSNKPMKHLLSICAFLLLFTNAQAQFSLKYQFEPNPDFAKYCKGHDLKTIDELEVIDERVVEFAYDKGGNLFEYFYIHGVRYVNSEDAIDRNNKIYVSFARAFELVSYDTRVVSANGNIQTLGKDALKEGTREDGTKVQYFAVSGAEKGSFIEYYYLVKRNPNYTGTWFGMQSNTPIAKSVVKIISPSNLVFISKSFGGFTNLYEDTSLADRNMLVGIQENIPAMPEEPFANAGGNKMKLMYQMYYNTAKGKKNPYNYGIVSQNIFENMGGKLNKEEQKALEKILKNCNLKADTDDESKIRAVENYLKKEYTFVDNSANEYENLTSILKSRTLNETGATRLFYHIFETLGIEQEIVVTSNRYNIRFDKEFESYSFLTDFLLYFPKLKTYMAPYAQLFRLGLIPGSYIENYGLFVRKVSIGELNTGAGKVQFIPSYPSNHTQHNMFITASLDESTDSLNIDYKQEYTGYYAQNFQPIFDFIQKDKLKEFEESIVKGLHPDISIKTIDIENKGGENLMLKPLVVNSKLSSHHFIEKAGNKILLKFGDLIGPQSEMYQEKQRVLPIENDYNREYHRILTFIIPEGYQIKNLEQLNLSVQPFKNNAAGFVATYKIEGNKLIVTCDEVYNQIHFPLEEAEQYRSVINAAANFNKIVLVLEKK